MRRAALPILLQWRWSGTPLVIFSPSGCAWSGALSRRHREEASTVEVPAGTAELRVALNSADWLDNANALYLRPELRPLPRPSTARAARPAGSSTAASRIPRRAPGTSWGHRKKIAEMLLAKMNRPVSDEEKEFWREFQADLARDRPKFR